jgi:hypothetical protein
VRAAVLACEECGFLRFQTPQSLPALIAAAGEEKAGAVTEGELDVATPGPEEP